MSQGKVDVPQRTRVDGAHLITMSSNTKTNATGKVPLDLKRKGDPPEKKKLTFKRKEEVQKPPQLKKQLTLKKIEHKKADPVVPPVSEDIEGALQFRGQLHPFQTKVFEWSKMIKRGILGLDMGLGKTIITLAIICQQQYTRTVAVLPLQLLEQWKKAILDFTNITSDNIKLYQGSSRHRMKLSKARIILTTYDVVRLDVDDEDTPLYRLREQCSCLIIDEAHKIRNDETQTYNACKTLGQSCEHQWLLTGTVIHNKFEDFYTLATFIDPRFTQAAMVEWKKKHYYRLTKTECLKELKAKIVTEHVLEFDEDHHDIYIDAFTEMRRVYVDYVKNPSRVTYGCLLPKILRLRQCCNHPDAMLGEEEYKVEKNHFPSLESSKFNTILQLIKDTPADDKILIFSQWDHTLKVLGRLLAQHKLSYLEYNGKLQPHEKNNVIDRFKDTKNQIQILLLTLTAGGVGLNLQFANRVIIVDSWWNPAMEEQAIDRVYRIGQMKEVQVHKLYMKDTIEEWMIKMKMEKKNVDVDFHVNDRHYSIDKGMLRKLLRTYICLQPDEIE